MGKYIKLNEMRAIPYDDFIKEASKLTKAKGQFDTVEENIRDYIKVTAEGNPVVEGVTYRDCFEVLLDIHQDIQFGGGKPCGFIKTKRNQISANLLRKIIGTIAVP